MATSFKQKKHQDESASEAWAEKNTRKAQTITVSAYNQKCTASSQRCAKQTHSMSADTRLK